MKSTQRDTAKYENMEKTWQQPKDWRFVTRKTSHKYIPFENTDVNI